MSDIKSTHLSDGHTIPRDNIEGHTLPAGSIMHGMAFRGQTHDFEDLHVEEYYDFVIAGAGISGLACAYFYQKRFGPDKRILIVDPLPHFGGHASRNEFSTEGRNILGYGGSESFQSPNLNFSSEVKNLIEDLGIELSRFKEKYFNHLTYPKLGLSRGTFFGKEIFGKDTLVSGDPTAWVSDDVSPENLNAKSYEDFFAGFPMSEKSKIQLFELYTKNIDVLERFPSPQEKIHYLKNISYANFLQKEWQLDQEAILYFSQRTLDFFGLAPHQIPALDACHYGLPGIQGMNLSEEKNDMGLGPLDEPYVYHFPDGNSSLSRLLVRSLIPSVAKGETMEDILQENFHVQELDSDKNSVRIRLEHTIAYVKNTGDGLVDVGLIHNLDKKLHRIKAKHCTLACFNMVIPYIFKDLTQNQAHALKMNVKVPMVYTNVLIKNWRAWVNLGVHEIYGVNTFHSRAKLDYSVTMGDYSIALDPADPIVVHMVHVPMVSSETDPRKALRQARKTFFNHKFEDYEKHVKEDLNRMLGPGGFDAENDILGITINRWSHGYSYSANTLIETEEESQRLMNLARKKVGNVTIANSDAGWNAYAHTAIDEAYRAVWEL